MKEYFENVHKNSYNFLLAGVLLLLYEVFMLVLPNPLHVANGVDVFFQSLIRLFSLWNDYLKRHHICHRCIFYLPRFKSRNGFKAFSFPSHVLRKCGLGSIFILECIIISREANFFQFDIGLLTYAGDI